jgi:Spy/CpxP family protein refolding chaperone
LIPAPDQGGEVIALTSRFHLNRTGVIAMVPIQKHRDRRPALILGSLVAAALVSLLPSVAEAQSIPGIPSNPSQIVASAASGEVSSLMGNLMKGINLTSAQKGPVNSIIVGAEKQIEAAASNPATVNSIMQKAEGEIRKLLTPHQQTQFDKNVAAIHT